MSQSIGGGRGPDEDVYERCADCSDEMDPAAERGFPVGSDAALCFRCAVARGGCWDEAQQRWSVEPDFADLSRGFD
jgi:hypothetical protein